MSRFTLEIELLEDLHIGAGIGWGDIDALQVRDRLGRPVLPSSHIKGVMRSAALEWHRFDPQSISCQQIDELFGCAGKKQGKLQLTGAYCDAQQVPKALIWGSTRISPRSGTADEGSLRFFEYIPAGSRFRMEAMLPDGETQLLELFKAIVARTDSLGSGRQRGNGRIRWSWTEQAPHATPVPREKASGTPCRLRLLLRNLDPICLPLTGHPGNLIASLSFIRGRTLRGAFVANCLQNGKAQLAQGLLADTLSWGDALPLPQSVGCEGFEQFEVLPIPLSIGTPKAKAPSSDLPWWATSQRGDFLGDRGEKDLILQQPQDQENLDRPKEEEFLFRKSPKDSRWQRYRPQILERLHTRVPSEYNKTEQALFSMEEIAEGTHFLADILLTEPRQIEILKEALQVVARCWLRVGRGGRPLELVSATWLPPATHGSKLVSEGFTLLLESDLIARDSLGNFVERLEAKTIADLVGFPADRLITRKSFSESRELLGFNAATGLPRLAQLSIKAGSVVWIEGEGATELRQRLAEYLALGECPEEGFGRFRIDFLPEPQCRLSSETEVSTSAPEHAFYDNEEKLCRKAQEWYYKFDKIKSQPSPSQWGEFRAAIQAASTKEEIDKIFDSLKDASKRLGGKAWKEIVEHREFPKLQSQVSSLPLTDAKTFLDYFVRWFLSGKKSKEEPCG
ncbi:RAMP superfamily CRISPR-associated protein [Candidatus Methylacidiphilum infernorum]|uniref:CRISPR system related protein, RAMP superfamily n=1 Tax=Methylacidiphilum infernorum (isolate V4) TaxID=481448 RepID=B3E1E0_METI4|nr:RAMP superfamily CRISPR-associated protein [Candidatus Methylacidiphilum infernorum]ACD82936.1 CRISPR system related protein, RAMP superfamily [Methylacidiphilum infernorum V4]